MVSDGLCIVSNTLVAALFAYLLMYIFTTHSSRKNCFADKNVSFFVKLRQGSGKDRQGMAVKAKGLKA